MGPVFLATLLPTAPNALARSLTAPPACPRTFSNHMQPVLCGAMQDSLEQMESARNVTLDPTASTARLMLPLALTVSTATCFIPTGPVLSPVLMDSTR